MQKVLWTSSQFDSEIWCSSVSADCRLVPINITVYTARFEPKDNTTGATCGAGKAHSSGTPDFTPVFYGVCVVFSICNYDFPVLSFLSVIVVNAVLWLSYGWMNGTYIGFIP